MASFLVAVQEEADVLSREWRARAGTDGKVTSPTSPTYLAYISPISRHISPKSPCISQVSLDCYAEMRRLTLAVILRVTFGLGEKGREFKESAALSDTIAAYLESIVATANELPPLWSISPSP